MIPIVFLRSVDIFEGLTDEELEQIQKRCCEEVDVESESTLFEEKEQARYLYSLTQGDVALRYRLPGRKTGQESTIVNLPAGSIFGWSSLMEDGHYTLSAYCTGKDCKAIRIDRDKLTTVLESNHTIGYKVMKNLTRLMAQRYKAFQEEITRLTGQNTIDGW
jgi:CRP-like cAMP-binding protein